MIKYKKIIETMPISRFRDTKISNNFFISSKSEKSYNTFDRILVVIQNSKVYSTMSFLFLFLPFSYFFL